MPLTLVNKSKSIICVLLAGLLLLVTVAIAFPPVRVAAIDQNSKDRRIVAAFGYCIINSIHNDDDGYTSWSDLFADDGSKEYAVVGVDINSNGVWTCLEAKEAAKDLLEEKGMLVAGASTDDLDERFEKTIFADSNNTGTFRSGGTDGIEDGYAKEKLREFAANVIQPFLDARPISDQELAERLLPAADLCYFYSDQAISGAEFTVTGSDGNTIYADKADLDGGRVVITELNMRDNSGTGNFGINTSTKVELGDIDLEWDVASSLGSDFGHNSDWYPLGQDFYNFSDRSNDNSQLNNRGFIHHNSIVDCDLIKDLKDTIFANFKLDADGETLLTKDGLSTQDIRGEGTEDINIGLAGGADNPTCESQGFNLSWILCPIINAALDSMDWMFRQFIEPFLRIQPLTTQDGDYAYQVWKVFRNLGNIILIFALLFIVFGQAIGGGLVDAYTAKKAMPRILIAAIGINLSFFLVAIMVDIFNILGAGVGRLISAPLDGNPNASFSFSLDGFAIGIGGVLALFFAGDWLLQGVTQGGFFPLLVLTVVLPMLLVIIAIFATVIIRRGIILVLAVISPIAIALFAIPNTEKYAKQWFSTLVKTLLVYPIIMAIFAIADLMSVMFFNASDDGIAASFVVDLVGIIVLFIPFFLIPFAFRIAGGAIGAAAGAFSNFGNKRLEHYKGNELDAKSRIYQAKQNKADIKTARQGARGDVFRRMSQYRSGRAQRASENIPIIGRRRYGRRTQNVEQNLDEMNNASSAGRRPDIADYDADGNRVDRNDRGDNAPSDNTPTTGGTAVPNREEAPAPFSTRSGGTSSSRTVDPSGPTPTPGSTAVPNREEAPAPFSTRSGGTSSSRTVDPSGPTPTPGSTAVPNREEAPAPFSTRSGGTSSSRTVDPSGPTPTPGSTAVPNREEAPAPFSTRSGGTSSSRTVDPSGPTPTPGSTAVPNREEAPVPIIDIDAPPPDVWNPDNNNDT